MDNDVIIFDEGDVNANKGMAIVMMIIPILFFLPLVVDSMKQSAYLKFYSNQVLLFIIAYFAIGLVNIIPILGQIVFAVGAIALFVFWIIVLVAVCKGEGKKYPIFGNIEIIK